MSRNRENYYITAAWNDLSLVPNMFEVGREGVTEATRMGIMEQYHNVALKQQTAYCVFVVVHIQSGVENVSGIQSVEKLFV